ncbi:MAG: hypothetical protein WEB09_04755, partial [Nitriliruptor sp.]
GGNSGGGNSGGGNSGGGGGNKGGGPDKGNRQQNSGGGNGGGGGGGGGGKRNRKGGSRKRSQNRRSKNRRPDVLHDAARFWGDSAQLPEASQDVRITDDPSAVPRSLGPPPLPGHEAIAEQYFGVVYDRAVGTAGLLAAAGGLIDPEDLTDEH